ncbi:MAG: alpha/beta fold hydrolase [Deltaproteobacteria bacterium]|nr:MAG: alpha/beta fold hydrolase [Deltaproteobacteria bacterium]
MKIKVNDIRVNYRTQGEGEYLVLIHGAGDNLEAWFGQLASFARSFRVLTYDLRGHGKTDLGHQEYSQDLWADDLYMLLKALNIRQASILGYSMGGGIAATFTLKHPQMVKALILSNAAGAVPLSEQAMKEMDEGRRAQLEALERDGMRGVWKLRRTIAFRPGFADENPALVEHYKRILLLNEPDGYRRVMKALAQPTSADFAKLACPTLIIAGEYDILLVPDAARLLQQRIPGSQLKILRTGHASPIEAPDEYNKAVLEFLSKIGG